MRSHCIQALNYITRLLNIPLIQQSVQTKLNHNSRKLVVRIAGIDSLKNAIPKKMTITFDLLGSTCEDEIYNDDEEMSIMDEILKDFNNKMREQLSEEKEKGINEIISLENLYSSDYDMQSTIDAIPDMTDQVKYVIDEIGKIAILPTWDDVEMFDSICLDVIEKIVRLNKNWSRMEALQEAARELVAVRKADQSTMAERVHSRVLYEFQISTDAEYLLLRKQIWEE